MWLLVALSLFAFSSMSLAAATACPSVPNVTLANHTSYSFINCLNVFSIFGTNVFDVALFFDNSIPGDMTFGGLVLANLSIVVKNCVTSQFMVLITAKPNVTNISVVMINVTTAYFDTFNTRTASYLDNSYLVNFDPAPRSLSNLFVGCVKCRLSNQSLLGIFIRTSTYVTTFVSNIVVSVSNTTVMVSNLPFSNPLVQLSVINHVLIADSIAVSVLNHSSITFDDGGLLFFYLGTVTVSNISVTCAESRLSLVNQGLIDLTRPTLAGVSIVISRGSVVELTSCCALSVNSPFSTVTRSSNISVEVANSSMRVASIHSIVYFNMNNVDGMSVTVAGSVLVASGGGIVSIAMGIATIVSLTLSRSTLNLTGPAMLFAKSTIVSWIDMTVERSAMYNEMLFCDGTAVISNNRVLADHISVSVVSSIVEATSTKMNIVGSVGLFELRNISVVTSVAVSLWNSSISERNGVFNLDRCGDVMGSNSSSIHFYVGHGCLITSLPTIYSTAFVVLLRNFDVTGDGATSGDGGTFVIAIDDSVVMMVSEASSNALLYEASVFQISSVGMGDGGTFLLNVNNSTISIAPSSANAVIAPRFDMCAIVSLTAVTSLSPDQFAITIANQSDLRVECYSLSSAYICQLSAGFAFKLISSGGTDYKLITSTLTLRSLVVATVTGSFLFMVIDSSISNSTIDVRDANITCGLVCEIAGVHWNDGAFYFLGASLILGHPALVVDRVELRNSTLRLSNCRVLTYSLSRQIAERRPLFSLTNVTNTSVILEGPVEFWNAEISGIIGGSGRDSQTPNKLVLLNCDWIQAHDQSGLSIPLAHNVATEDHGVVIQSTRASGHGSCFLTSTASVAGATNSATTAVSASRSNSLSLALPRTVAKSSMSTARIVMSGASSIIMLLAGPAVATSIQMLQAQQALASCPENDVTDPPDFLSSPTQLELGSSSGAYIRGGVAGNALLLTACGVVAALLVGAATLTGRASAAKLRLPGLLYTPHSFLLVPTMTSATVMLVNVHQNIFPTSTMDVFIACAGYFAMIAPLTLLLIVTTVKFSAHAVEAAGCRSPRSLPHRLVSFYDMSVEWESLDNSPGFVERWDDAGMFSFVENRQWFVVLSVVIGLLTAVIAGLTALGQRWCTFLKASECIFAVVYCLLLFLLQPYGGRAESWINRFNSVLQSATSVLILLGRTTNLTSFEFVQTLVNGIFVAGSVASMILRKVLTRSRQQEKRQRRRKKVVSREVESGLLQRFQVMMIPSGVVEDSKQAGKQRADALRQLITAACRRSGFVPHEDDS